MSTTPYHYQRGASGPFREARRDGGTARRSLAPRSGRAQRVATLRGPPGRHVRCGTRAGLRRRFPPRPRRLRRRLHRVRRRLHRVRRRDRTGRRRGAHDLRFGVLCVGPTDLAVAIARRARRCLCGTTRAARPHQPRRCSEPCHRAEIPVEHVHARVGGHGLLLRTRAFAVRRRRPNPLLNLCTIRHAELRRKLNVATFLPFDLPTWWPYAQPYARPPRRKIDSLGGLG